MRPESGLSKGREVALWRDSQPGAFVIHDRLLNRSHRPAFLGLGNRRDEFGRPARVHYFLGRLPVLVELPVALGARVRRIQDGAVEERIGHRGTSLGDGRNGDGRNTVMYLRSPSQRAWPEPARRHSFRFKMIMRNSRLESIEDVTEIRKYARGTNRLRLPLDLNRADRQKIWGKK